jgi:hypothetical protein
MINVLVFTLESGLLYAGQYLFLAEAIQSSKFVERYAVILRNALLRDTYKL